MAITVRHVTRFVYDKDAYESHNDVRLHPFDDQFQKCVSFKLTVEPEETVVPFTDYFGNRGHSISIHRPHDALTIAAESVIEKIAEAIEPAKDVIFNDFLRDDVVQTERAYEFLGESRYIQFSSRLRSFFWMARPRPMEGVAEYVERIVSYVRDQLQYEPGVTDVFSSADDMLKAGAGVCQDFSHLTIGVLRLAGVPARYVSGYLLPDTSSNGTGSRQQASHAWLEAKLPNTGWTGFDPTHGCRADARHIRVAIGRDYDDATPIRGVFRSRGHSQQMTVELSVLPGQSQSQSQGSQSQQQ